MNTEQKEVIKETMGIQSEIIYKDKIIIEKSNKKGQKSKLSEFNYDDY